MSQSLDEMGFSAVLSMMGTPQYEYNADDIEEAFLRRSTFGVQDVLSAYRFLERRSGEVDSLVIPLHILWCADGAHGATFSKGLSHAVARNLCATLEFFETKSDAQIQEIDPSELGQIVATAKQDLGWFAKNCTHQETLARIKRAANVRA